MQSERPGLSVYTGLFAITLATLMHEILLTRIFSVTMWYHFAFMAISIAMFGMTVGAIIVFIAQRRKAEQPIAEVLVKNALRYAISLSVGFLVYLNIPFYGDTSAQSLFFLTLSYTITAIPFVFSGIIVAFVLTTYRQYAATLYAADLIGAAFGCMLLIVTLESTDAAAAVFVVAAFGALGAVAFSRGDASARSRRIATAVASLLVIMPIALTLFAPKNKSVISMTDTARIPSNAYHYERWNSHSRVTVFGNPFVPGFAAGWGLSQKTKAAEAQIQQLQMTIDTWAGTPITYFHGDLAPLWYLKDDVTNVVHYVRPHSHVFIVGVGGGRDVLSALVFHQDSVTGVEVNRDVLRATVDTFGDFAGHIERHPKVKLEVDEARSYLTRLNRRFDIIQLSLIDTWAATAAGAFVLTENSLYTVEAWTTFLRHLTPRGVLSVSRWYYPKRPGEALRLTSLAREALMRVGVQHPRRHVVMVKAPVANGVPGLLGNGVATILVARQPFSEVDLEALNREIQRLGFDYLVAPSVSANRFYAAILDGGDVNAIYSAYPLDITPPTDDRPFFFQMLRIRNFFRPLDANFGDPNLVNLGAVKLLCALLCIIALLTIACILLPLAVASRGVSLRNSAPLLIFFLAIGLGFMFVEVSEMHRLMVLLGMPTYALSVVLFTLLLSSGIGSLSSSRLVGKPGRLKPPAWLACMVIAVSLLGLVTPSLVQALSGATTAMRIFAAVGTLAPIGFFMGLPFPFGIERAKARPELVPWLWGLNGAASVLCSVLATTVAISFGITASFFSGVVCYVIAFLAYISVARS